MPDELPVRDPVTDDVLELPFEPLELKMGPSHPATHGTVRINLKLDGETVQHAEVEVGFLHRGFEKECESGLYYQAFPYTDRLNYVSAIINNVGYALACEKLLGIEVPPRCQYLRVLGSEISRMGDHFTCLGAAAMELGAMTGFLYVMEARELVWDVIDVLCGSRVTSNYVRIGGLSEDVGPGFSALVREKLARAGELQQDFEDLLLANPIFRERMEGTGKLASDELIALGVTGPLLRAAGVPYDVRRAQPYLVYDRLDFEVPIGEEGDNMDRFLVRVAELKQSRRMVEQCLDQLPDGPVDIDNPHVRLPGKRKVFNRMEELIAQFKLVTEGPRPPVGEVYQAVEGGNGELGFYLVSDGSGKPYKCRARSPSFSNTQALSRMLQGAMFADVVPTFDMINMIGGECDR
ncbi:MAG TPA: NADH-quinone oxidoreductase subunit D [Candidatus Methylomirabilis sp.]|nr:NADH-quinone oxidoreductase subunit D [Candidatus Methylomirabilis sp.]